MCGFAGYILTEKTWENRETTLVDLTNISKKIMRQVSKYQSIFK